MDISMVLMLIIQCLSLKCRPQHGGWQWQLLIAQVPAGKSKAVPPLHRGLQLSKITKKNNHVVPYNMRCWKCCPPSSTHFWHLFRKCAFTRINSISEIQSISCLILAFNSSNMWKFVIFKTNYFITIILEAYLIILDKVGLLIKKQQRKTPISLE